MRSAGDSAGWRSSASGTVSVGDRPAPRSGRSRPVDGDVQRAALEAIAAVGPGQRGVERGQRGPGGRSGRGGRRPGLAPTLSFRHGAGGQRERAEQHDDEEREDESLHGQAGSPHGCGRPSLPGLRIPCGVERGLRRGQHVERVPERGARVAGPVEADAVMVAQRGAARERRLHAGVPRGAVEALTLLHRRVTAEGEVEAGAVDVRVRQVGRRQHHAVDRPQRGEHAVVDAAAAPTTGAAISMVSTTKPVLDEVLERGDVVALLEPHGRAAR